MARYRDAVKWIANNNGSSLVGDDDLFCDTIELVAHLFGKDCHHVASDVMNRRSLDQRAHERAIRAEEDEEARMMDENPMYDGL